jgi:D-alanine--poly(phosphoribitol) ligase subunit 2
MTHTRQKIYQKIVELAQQQGKDATSLRFQDSIPDFGVLDSAALWELIVWFENEFGLEIEPEQLTVTNFGTIDAMASYAEKAGI